MDGALTFEVSGNRADAPTECDAKRNAAASVIVHINELTETLECVDPLSKASGPGVWIAYGGYRASNTVVKPGGPVQASA